MKKLAQLKTAILFLGMFGAFFGQEKRINEQTFVKQQDKWKIKDSKTGRLFDMSNEITIQFDKSPSKAEIYRLEKENNIKFIRSNELGYYDFKVLKTNLQVTTIEKISKTKRHKTVFANSLGTYGLVPNDPQTSTQWYLEQSSDKDVDAQTAWNLSTGNSSVVVAVLDSGTEFTHNDIGLGADSYQNVYLNPGEDAWSVPNNPSTGNGIDDDGDGFIDNWKGWNFSTNSNDPRGTFWHGTHVAGIVGAKTNNSVGISGIAGGYGASGSKMLLLGVGNTAPDGSVLDDAILYAKNKGAKVIQLSLSVASSPAIDAALQSAYTSGVFIVCSAGNGGAVPVGYPANNTYVFSAGATTQTDTRATFSQNGVNLDLSAPGVSILSTQLSNTYATSQGTSFSSPIISGTVALMRSVNSSMSNAAVEDALKCSAEKVGGYNYNWNASKLGHSNELGYGRLNTYNAVLASQTKDLYIKDTPTDNGVTPSSGAMWTSPDIWVRNDDDGGLTHENPEYKMYSPNWVYIRVTRKSCSMLTNAEVRLYFSKASTGLSWPANWISYYQTTSAGSILHGDQIGSVIIPTSPSNEVIVKIPWYPPNPANFDSDVHHFCLVARIISPDDPMGIETTDINANTANNNNIAWKNVSVYNVNGFDNAGPSVFIRNVNKKVDKVNLAFRVNKNTTGLTFTELGEMYIIPDKKLYESFLKASAKGLKETEKGVFLVVSEEVGLYDVYAPAFESYSLQMVFKPRNEQRTKDKSELLYDIIQSDATGAFVGGEQFILNNFNKEISQKTDKITDGKAAQFIEDKMEISPNPSSGEFKVSFPSAKKGILSISNVQGKVVFRKEIKNEREINVNLNLQRKGMYYVSFESGGKKIQKKYLKK